MKKFKGFLQSTFNFWKKQNIEISNQLFIFILFLLIYMLFFLGSSEWFTLIYIS